MWVAVCVLLSQSHTWLPFTRRSVSPNGAGSAIRTCVGPSYQICTMWLPDSHEAADCRPDGMPPRSGSAGKPRFALSVTVAVAPGGSFARCMAASS